MTTLVEKKRDRDVVFGFLTVMFALVSLRAWSQKGPILLLFVVLTGLNVAAWVWIRRQPLSEIVVSPAEITITNRGAVERRIVRTPDTVLTFRSTGNYKHRTWQLSVTGDPEEAGIAMVGFRPPQVAAACREHGWVFADDSVF